MASHPSDPTAPRPGGSTTPLSEGGSAPPNGGAPKLTEDELLPEWDVPLEQIAPAAEVAPLVETAPVTLPAAEVAEAPLAEPVSAPPEFIHCPVCGTDAPWGRSSCDDCGYFFTDADLAAAHPGSATAAPATATATAAPTWLQERFEITAKISERSGVERFRGRDHGDKSGPPVPVVILRQALPQLAAPIPLAEPVAAEAVALDEDEEILPDFDDIPMAGSGTADHTDRMAGLPSWPSLAWERGLLETVGPNAVPAEVAYLTDETHEYLVEEVPQGRTLWDAWDDPDATWDHKLGLLVQVAGALHGLHNNKVILEGLRPDHVIVSDEGTARLNDLADLLPLPLPADAPIRGTFYTAPELTAGHGKVDARADLYSFGAMLYSLHVGRELTEMDFDLKASPGTPKPFIPRFPDIHPAFGRLMMKTFRREPDGRFPTDEAGKEDPTGFVELIRTLNAMRRFMDTVRLEVASWTTTGMIRTGNEDAFALLHACETRQDDLSESALILLCDGMGGYEAGEVAAALAIQCLRQNLLSQKPFVALAGQSGFASDPLGAWNRPEGHNPAPLNPDVGKQLLKAALQDANKQVYAASRVPGSKRRGMGCTAEAVYVDGRHVIVGHVGDSRTYHLSEGRMIQLTRDQTLVNRLVELGTLSEEEAENHPRKNELQQAIGGQPNVEPGVYASKLKPGDWILVCSDGLTNHVGSEDLRQMLAQEAWSAETAARRLANLVNLEGATDNATIVVIRCT